MSRYGIKCIKVGTLMKEAEETPNTRLVELKKGFGIGGGSNVVLIEGEGRKILVDTGYEFGSDRSEANELLNRKSLELALALKGFKPEDIDTVFITHSHYDHFGNIGLFEGAEWVASRPVADRMDDKRFNPLDDGEEICEGIRALYTPGHTEAHCSLIVEDETTTAIAGDAIVSIGYFDRGKLWNYNPDFFDYDTGLTSMAILASSAEIIIPGHGVPFGSYRPTWMNNA